MIIAITGTPGTGKTMVAKAVADHQSLEYVSVNRLIEELDVEREHDDERDADAVDPVDLRQTMMDTIDDDTVLDGHLSQLYPADYIIVLRCHPDELQTRLAQRDWPQDKIDENIGAERLDIVLQQAMADHTSVLEIDTTDRTPAETAACIEDGIEAQTNAYKPGHISWKMPTPGETE